MEHSSAYVAYEYATKDPSINMARVEIRGRLPEKGFMRNNAAKEIVYVESGQGVVTINGSAHSIGKGDVIFYEPGEEIAWEGALDVIVACTPPWTAEQHEILGET